MNKFSSSIISEWESSNIHRLPWPFSQYSNHFSPVFACLQCDFLGYWSSKERKKYKTLLKSFTKYEKAQEKNRFLIYFRIEKTRIECARGKIKRAHSKVRSICGKWITSWVVFGNRVVVAVVLILHFVHHLRNEKRKQNDDNRIN